MMLKPTTLSLLPFCLLLTDAFTCVNPPTVKGPRAPRHAVTATFIPPVDAAVAPSIMMATQSPLDTRMSGLARLLDEMADPTAFWSPPSSLFKRLDMTSPATTAIASIRVDVKETDEAYTIVADMPGIKKEDVKLSWVNSNTLQIAAERKEEREETSKGAGVDEQQQQQLQEGKGKQSEQYYFKEVSYGKVFRSFRLPQNADAQHVQASLKDGVLRVTVPKKELPSEHAIPIH